ncbi:MAG: hypothetical protein AB7U20_17585 [Planctomycetaceae bacterium]
MTEIVADSPTREKLAAADAPVRIIDAEGRLLGTFRPAVQDEIDLIPPMSLDDMRRHASQPGGRPLSEILKDLEESA